MVTQQLVAMIYLHGLTDKHCRVSQSAKDESAVTQGLLKKPMFHKQYRPSHG